MCHVEALRRSLRWLFENEKITIYEKFDNFSSYLFRSILKEKIFEQQLSVNMNWKKCEIADVENRVVTDT